MANSNGVLSQWITLSYADSASGSFTALNDLQSIPDLGAAPAQVEVTCLGDTARRYMNGIKDFGNLEFGFLYDKTQFDTLNGITGNKFWKVEISALSGGASAGTFTFEGQPSVRFNGAGINEALTYTLSIALQSDIEFA